MSWWRRLLHLHDWTTWATTVDPEEPWKQWRMCKRCSWVMGRTHWNWEDPGLPSPQGGYIYHNRSVFCKR